MSAHFVRVLRSRLCAAATAVLDRGIGFLQRLRKSAGGKDTKSDEDRPGSRKDRPGGRQDEAAEESHAEPPKPRRRVLAVLINLSMMLAGGTAGGALAYHLLEQLLDRKIADSVILEATIAKQTSSTAAAEKKLAEAQAKLIAAEKKLEASSITAAEKKLEEAQAGRTDAEKKLEASRAEYAKTAAEKQKRLDEAVKLLDVIIAAERGDKTQPPGSRVGASSRERPPTRGDCTLQTGNVAALKDCIANFNR